MKFVKVSNPEGTMHWVDITKAEAISVEEVTTGGGFDIRSTVDPTVPKHNPKKTAQHITLRMISGADELLVFSDEAEADDWLAEHFGIRTAFL